MANVPLTLDSVIDIPSYLVRKHKLQDDAMTVNDILCDRGPSLLHEIGDYLVERARDNRDDPEMTADEFIALVGRAEAEAAELREAATLTPRPETPDEASDREAVESLPMVPVEAWSTPELREVHATGLTLIAHYRHKTDPDSIHGYEVMEHNLRGLRAEIDRRWEHGKRILRAAVIWMQCAAIRAEAYAIGAESLPGEHAHRILSQWGGALGELARADRAPRESVVQCTSPADEQSTIERCAIEVARARRQHEASAARATALAIAYPRELTTDAIMRRDAKRAATLARVRLEATLAALDRAIGTDL